MGAYLSQPKTDKVSTDEVNELLRVGASSMQGWRISQEDAHNAILNFDANASFFAVYDGHGGAEVATYCADKLPEFLKELASYKDGTFEQALKDAFLMFDRTLLEPQVVDILKILAGEKNITDPDDSDAIDGEEDDEDLAELHEESNLPLNEVLEKYKGAGCGPSMPALKKLKDTASSKPQSPYLRGRRAAAVAADAANKAVMDPDAKPQGSSTSAAAAAAASGSSNDAGPSSSKSSSDVCSKMETEEDSTVSSSSSSGSKSNNNNIASTGGTEAEATAANETKEITTNGSTTSNKLIVESTATIGANTVTANSCLTPDSSHIKESEQNGNVTSSAKVIKADVSTSSPLAGVDPKPMSIVNDATVSGSSDAAEAENKQNGSVGSSSSSVKSTLGNVERTTISSTSTSKAGKKGKSLTGDDDSTDDDYDAENSSADEQQVLGYSSSEDIEEDDDEEDDDEDDEDMDDEDEEDEEADDEDEEGALANEQFCANMIEEPGKDSGCTAVVALLHGRDLYVANAGDSRCVVCRNGKAIEMSLDHKPEDDEESARIIKAGGRVTLDGRVNGGLNLSRAIGDHAYKMSLELLPDEQMISALPDIKKLIVMPEDEFMVLACDGIWNFMSSEEVVDFVRMRLKDSSKKISQICEELFDNCLAPNTLGDGTGCDNMTAVIVCFQRKLQELPTKINPDETEEVLSARRAAAADAADASLQISLKRSASPNTDGNSNEAIDANKTKRLKTDEEDGSTSSTTNNNNASIATTNELADSDVASSSTTLGLAEQKECDSVSAAASTSTTTSSSSEALST